MISDELIKRMTTIEGRGRVRGGAGPTASLKHFANDTIFHYLNQGDINLIEDEVTEAFQGVLKALVINTTDDHNSYATARRVAKMFVHEIFRGRYYLPPDVTAFPNAKQ